MICVCVFFLCVYVHCTTLLFEIILQFKILGGFQWQGEYPWCIIEVKRKNSPTVFK
ncbi:Uncharacterized protein FWK35_00038139 [Aphis craccivora]|uniref:Uncharacterized protein n=1 Tax=Aphis craccivora TaxID=307492 RepID=A0A6G0YY84_APHCR|nr:Uncharacterized protein FWK35_00038139 [Aphis craccivora]